MAVLKYGLEVERLYLLLNPIEETKCLGIDDLFVFFEQSSELHRHGAEINPPYETAILLGDLRHGDYLLPLINKRDVLRNHDACPDVSVNSADSRAKFSSLKPATPSGWMSR